MTGRQTLRETKAQVRRAFAERGLDVERWLDEQMRKLQREPPPAAEAVKSLRLLRNALRRQTRATKKRKSAANIRTRRSAHVSSGDVVADTDG